jgi:hypothetical protein
MQGIPGQKQTRPMEEYYDNIDKKDPRSAVAIPKVGSPTKYTLFNSVIQLLEIPKVGSPTKYTIFTFAKRFFWEIFKLQLRKVLESTICCNYNPLCNFMRLVQIFTSKKCTHYFNNAKILFNIQ